MNKQEFMTNLKRLLPVYDSREILNDFEEHFLTGLEQGKTEEEIAADLGDPVEIAKGYGYNVEGADTLKSSTSNTSSTILAIIGIVFFDLIIGIALVFSILGIWISLWSIVLSLLVTGISLIIAAFTFITQWYVLLFAGISLLGLAVLAGIGMIYVTKYLGKGLVWFGKFHVKVIRGRDNNI